MASSTKTIDVALRAIAAPRRRQILLLVRDGELTAGAIAENFNVTRPAISQHLRHLKDAGLLFERREGTKRWYRARPQGLSEVHDFLEAMWDDRLERLRRAAESEAQRNGA